MNKITKDALIIFWATVIIMTFQFVIITWTIERHGCKCNTEHRENKSE